MTMHHEWWRDFFGGLAADFWHALPTPAMTAGEVDLLLQRLQPIPGARLLDVPCGDGRHAAELQRRGFDVLGVDGSEALVAHAHAAGVRAERRDMRELARLGPFDAAYCLGNSFGYLDDPGNLAFLRAVHDELRPGGDFLLDATVAETILPNLKQNHSHEAAGIRFRGAVSYDPATGVLRSDYDIARGAEREQKSAFVRIYTASHLIAMLREAGFGEVAVMAPDGAPFVLGAPRAWFTARA
ncbi:MAG: class I SAM-dependent methyltransferase [Planctomycetota bacterium]